MKKIIALALALIMALSLGSVAFAAVTVNGTVGANGYATYTEGYTYAPGTKILVDFGDTEITKVTGTNFTKSAEGDFNGASYIESVKVYKEDKTQVVVTLKESYTLDTEKEVKGTITLKLSGETTTYTPDAIKFKISNNVPADELTGVKKVKELDLDGTPTVAVKKDTVQVMDEDGGYVFFKQADLVGIVKMNKEEKVYLNIDAKLGDDDQDAFEALVGEDYLDDAHIEYYVFETTAFKNDVDFQYDAYEEDDHFFYAFDGEKLTKLDAVYNDDEDVEKYEFTATAKGAIIVTDVEIVLAAEEDATKNPDTGANDVVGVAAALAVVSLVAAGAVALKK